MMNKSEMIENVKKAKTGDKGAFSILYQHYSPLLKKYLVKLGADYHDAEDISAETFMEVIEEISSLKNDEYFSTWMYSIAKNKFYTLAKAANKHQRVEFSSYSEEGDTFVNDLDIAAMNSAQYSGDEIVLPEDFAANEDIKRKLAEIINSLGDKEKETVYLRYYEGHSVSQISKETKAAEGTVKARLHHARKYIEKKVKELQSKGYVLSVTPFPAEKMYNILKKSKYAEMITPQAAAVVTAGRSLAVGLASVFAAGVVGFTAIFGMGLFHNKDGDKWDVKDDSSIVVEEEKKEEEPTIIDYSTGNWVDLGVGSEGFYEDPVAHPLSRYYECTNENNDDTFFIEIKSYKQNLDDYKIYVEYTVFDNSESVDDLTPCLFDLSIGGRPSRIVLLAEDNQSESNRKVAIFNFVGRINDILNTENDMPIEFALFDPSLYISKENNKYIFNGLGPITKSQQVVSYPFDYMDDNGLYYYCYDINDDTTYVSKGNSLHTDELLYQYPTVNNDLITISKNARYILSHLYSDSPANYRYDKILNYNSYLQSNDTASYFFNEDNIFEHEFESPLRPYKNIIIEKGNKHFKYIDDVLYYVFDDGNLALLWSPKIETDVFKFPDNIIIYDKMMLENIKANDYIFGINDCFSDIN